MPFINESLDNVQEKKPAPEGEYDLKIVKATETESKKGRPMIKILLEFDDGTDAPPFMHYLLAWTDDDDDDAINNRKLDIKRFCHMFDVAEDFDAADLTGQTTRRAMVKQEVGDDDVVRNRLVLTRLKD